MLNEIDIMLHLEHHKDLLRQVDQERLAKLAAAVQTKQLEKKTKIQKTVRLVEAPCCSPAGVPCCAG